MSDYEDLKRSVEEQCLLINSTFGQYTALLEKRDATDLLMREALAREKQQQEVAFFPGEIAQFSSTGFTSLGNYLCKKFLEFKDGLYREASGVGWSNCRRPKNEPGVFVRHVGNECPVSDPMAAVIVLGHNGMDFMGRASSFTWDNKIIGYVIIPDWAKELIK